MPRRLALLALLSVLSLASTGRAQELDQAVAGIEATYGKVNDLRAEFTQAAHNRSLGQDITCLSSPGTPAPPGSPAAWRPGRDR